MHWIDPLLLPQVTGTVKQFVMNRDGALDGLVLSDETGQLTLVHFPPHMAGDIEAAISTGDHITVHGMRPRDGAVFLAVMLVAPGGNHILDEGPDGPHRESEALPGEAIEIAKEITGTVRLSLFGPKGELRGALLEDGTVIRIGKKEAPSFTDLLKPAGTLAVRGTAIVSRYGVVVEADAIGADLDHLLVVKGVNPDKPKKPNHGHAEV
jgi:hypothetical protein